MPVNTQKKVWPLVKFIALAITPLTPTPAHPIYMDEKGGKRGDINLALLSLVGVAPSNYIL